MIIECPNCDSKVDAKVIADRAYPESEFGPALKVLFLECPVCNSTMIGESDRIQVDYDEYDWSTPERRWPNPVERFHYSIPQIVRKSLEEAKKCFGAQAYSACAVMCGRAIEGICAEQKTKAKMLAGGLKELKDRGIIDQRLYDWGDALRDQRNIGAHANEEDISKQDAQDVLAFALAICEYVFVLSEKYEDFMERQNQRKAKKSAKKVAKNASSVE